MESPRFKTEEREKARLNRRLISSERRDEAEKALLSFALTHWTTGLVMSFSSYGTEISTLFLNQILAQEKRLLLPRRGEAGLVPYIIEDLTSLEPNGKLLEPNPSLSEPWKGPIDIILVPALAFDSNNHRLGYGKGHYDWFLTNWKGGAKSIGIGFKEQGGNTVFPIESHDVPLDEVALF